MLRLYKENNILAASCEKRYQEWVIINKECSELREENSAQANRIAELEAAELLFNTGLKFDVASFRRAVEAQVEKKDKRIAELEVACKQLNAYVVAGAKAYEAAVKRIAELEALLTEARDNVAEDVSEKTQKYAGYPSMDRRIAPDRELLARIDAALSGKGE
jgi:predicted  nucleic acid-binding Zn-ribbon protein